jgi:hypothetical protein
MSDSGPPPDDGDTLVPFRGLPAQGFYIAPSHCDEGHYLISRTPGTNALAALRRTPSGVLRNFWPISDARSEHSSTCAPRCIKTTEQRACSWLALRRLAQVTGSAEPPAGVCTRTSPRVRRSPSDAKALDLTPGVSSERERSREQLPRPRRADLIRGPARHRRPRIPGDDHA